MTGVGGTSEIYVTHNDADVVVTQFCTSRVTGGVALIEPVAGTTFVQTTESTVCQSFETGMTLPRGKSIKCATSSIAPAGTYFCTMMGFRSPDPIAPN